MTLPYSFTFTLGMCSSTNSSSLYWSSSTVHWIHVSWGKVNKTTICFLFAILIDTCLPSFNYQIISLSASPIIIEINIDAGRVFKLKTTVLTASFLRSTMGSKSPSKSLDSVRCDPDGAPCKSTAKYLVV